MNDAERGGARGGPRGFTLIEILMALMVLAIGLASVLSVFIVGVRASRDIIDESAAAVAAKSALQRVLSEDADYDPADPSTFGRDFLEAIETARNAGSDWVWLHDKTDLYAGTIDQGEAAVPDPVPVAPGSRYCWRGRASRHRGDPGDPIIDLGDNPDKPTDPIVPLARGRVPEGVDPDTGVAYWKDATHPKNRDNDELWRLTIEVYRDFTQGSMPLATFDTLVCTAHR